VCSKINACTKINAFSCRYARQATYEKGQPTVVAIVVAAAAAAAANNDDDIRA